ncbi:adenylate cyclase [Acrasis kona]|uniref:Adenylate cyclase n=1 Tax=Acrasis kona TaxID=1008807 RepID=A0AAW2YJ30_9EUKA
MSSVANGYLGANVETFTTSLMQMGPSNLKEAIDYINWSETFQNNNIVSNMSNEPLEARRYFYGIAHSQPSYGSTFWGNDEGVFQSVMVNDAYTICPRAAECYNYYFDNVTMTNTSLISRTTYNSTARPWYMRSKETNKMGWTDVYLTLFGGQTVNALAVTLSAPLLDKSNPSKPIIGSIGITYDLTRMSTFLSKNTETTPTEIFIIDENGLIVATSIGEVQSEDGTKRILATSHSTAVVRDAAQAILGRFGGYNNVVASEIHYLDSNRQDRNINIVIFDDGLGVHWIIATVVFHQQLLNYVNIMTLVSGLCSIFTVILTVFISILFGLCITRPIQKVSDDMRLIAKGSFDSKHTSRMLEQLFTLKEFRDMADSMSQMRMGLRNFEKYVPGDVVREMLSRNAGVQLGVQPRRLTIMFLDIANFTGISEVLNSLQLVKLMSLFFTEMSQAVMASGGTVDKFIGDCVMAFWNAPMEVEGHEVRGIEAGLEMMKRIKYMNQEASHVVLKTLGIRIGVHTSDCLIGNVGSPARINYTCLGDGVNLASRLEGVNKRFGTVFCIGDVTYEAVKTMFTCRWLDYVSVKGKEDALNIYEVLCTKDESSEELLKWCEIHDELCVKLHELDFVGVVSLCKNIINYGGPLGFNNKPAELLMERLSVENPTKNLILVEK